MKKLLCLLLCLMLPVAAMAAPMRAMRDSVLSEAELATMRSWLDGVVRDALPLQYDSNTYVGAYVYSCVEDGGCYVLECDVYLEEGGDSLPEFAADNALTWLCDATVCVKRNGNEYELVSVEAGVNRPEGIWMALPMTICTARASPKARVMPKMTAVISDGAALLSTTFQMVCQRVHPSA